MEPLRALKTEKHQRMNSWLSSPTHPLQTLLMAASQSPTWLYLQTGLFFHAISLNPIKFIFLFKLRFCFTPSLSLEVTCYLLVQNANQAVLLPSLKTLCDFPLFLASSSSSLACQHGPRWPSLAHLSDQMFPHPHQLHFYTQTSTPRCSGCMLLLEPASPTTFIHSPGEPHSSFPMVQDASPPESSLSPQEGMNALSLKFPLPYNLSHHIVFTFPSALMAGPKAPQGRGSIPHIHLPMPSTEQQTRATVGVLWILEFQPAGDLLKLLVKLYTFRFLKRKNHFLKSLQFLY